MTRELLLQYICPTTCTKDCSFLGRNGDVICDYCYVKLNEWLDEYDKYVIEQYKDIHDSKANTNLKDTIRDIHDNVAREMYCKGIDGFANWLVEQGILGNRCISDGEITDYGKVYAKKYKEQLKAGNKE